METQLDQITLSSSAEFPAIPHAKKSNFLWMVSLKAPLYKADSRASVDLVAVLDKSGSMSGEKMNLCKETLKFVAEQLSESDRLSIVEYDDNVNVALPLTKMSVFGKETSNNAITNIQIGGCTNLCGGLCEGVHVIRKRDDDKNEVASVLLLTDGQANSWHRDLDSILSAVRTGQRASASTSSVSPYSNTGLFGFANNNVAQGTQHPLLPPQTFTPGPSAPEGKSDATTEMDIPCSINTFGYGGDHDSKLLKGLAEAGSGIYYFIKGTNDVPEAFADCLGGLLSVAAQKISLRIETAPGVRITKLYTKFRTTEVKPNECYDISLGDIQSEEQRDLIFSLELPETENAIDEFPLGTATLTYFNVLTSSTETISTSTIIARPVTIEEQKRNFMIDKHFNRLMSAEAMTAANEAGSRGDYKEGQRILDEAISRISESVSAKDEFCQGLIKDLQQCRENMRDHSSYTNTGTHMLSNNVNSHYMQRTSSTTSEAQNAYTTSARAGMQSKRTTYFTG